MDSAAGPCIPDDLPAVVDTEGRAASAESAEILHGTAAVKEGVRGAAAGIGIPDDLPAVVDAIGVTSRSAECAQVLHGTAAVKEGMVGIVLLGIPTTCPLLLMPVASLYVPPSVPRSVTVY